MKKVVIVEKRKTIREGIKVLINRFSQHECSETFEDFQVFKDRINIIAPDILLIDINHKGISIIDELRSIKSIYPNLAIIVLTMNEENELIFDALANGATAYIHKNAPSSKLVKVLEDAANGKMAINSLVARKAIKFIEINNMTNQYHKNELKLLRKVTEGNNLLAIEKTLKMNRDEIKEDFCKIFEQIFLLNNKGLLESNK